MTKLRGIDKVHTYLLDLRESNFSQLQKIALKTCKRFNDQQYLNELQSVLIAKEKQEKKVETRLKAIKEGTIDVESCVDLNMEDGQAEVLVVDDGQQAEDLNAYDLGNVIFQRDNLKDRLKLAQEEIERLKAQNVKLQTQLIDEGDLEDNLQNYG